MRQESKNRAPTPIPYWLDAVALALTPWTILVQGHRFGTGYHEIMLAFMRHIQNPGWLVNDWMMSTSPGHPHLVEPLAGLATVLGEPATLLLAHFFTRLILLMGVWRLADALLPERPWVGIVAMAGVILEPRFLLGAHYLQGGHWEPAFLGMAFAVWTLAGAITLVEGRSHWTGMALSGGFAIVAHLFVGLPVFLVCLAAVVWMTREWKGPLGILGAGMFIGSIAWVPAARGFLAPGYAPLGGQEVIQLLQFRHPHHHQPWLWPLSHYLQAWAVLAAGGWALWKLLPAGERHRLGVPAVLFGYFVMSCVAFTIAGRLQVLSVVAYFQCFRILSLFLLFAQIGALGWLLRVIGSRYIWLYVPAGLIMLLSLRMVDQFGPLIFAGLLAVLPVLIKKAAVTGSSSFLRKRFLVASPILLLVGVVLIAWVQRSPRPQQFLHRFKEDHWLSHAIPRERARAELMLWVRRNTNPMDVFVIPPRMEAFRIWEERPIVIDFRTVPFENAPLAGWAERMAQVTGVDPYEPFTQLPEGDPLPERLIAAGRAYNARYAVVRGPLDDPRVVYRNEKYTVISLAPID